MHRRRFLQRLVQPMPPKENAMNGKRLLPSLAAASLALAVVTAAQAASGPMHRDAFRADMRKLWEDHVTWTRLFIVSVAGNLGDTKATTDRLLQNQADIGNAIVPFYGRAAGDKLTSLLRDHILIAADLVGAAKANDTAKVAA